MNFAGTRRRTIALVAYASILVPLAIGVVTVLPTGNRIDPAPQAPLIGAVVGEGVDCLGPSVVAVQSGTFLDLHVPGAVGDGSEDLGRKIVGGRVERETGAAELSGTCRDDTPLAGGDALLVADIDDGVGLTGVVVVEGRRLATEIGVEDELPGGDGVDSAIDGAELLARILLAVAVIIAAARLLGSMFGRINQPRVIGEIVAGILLGPSLLGLAFPVATGFLFPSAVTEVLGVLAQFGLIFFMFLIGLELDHRMIRGSGRTAVLISHYSIVVPFTLGLAAALIVYPLVGAGDFTGFALFMGASMAITAFPVLARILTDTGLHRSRIGALAITCAAVDDVTAWCILAVVVAIVKATGALDAIQTVALAMVFVVGMLTVVRPLAARVLSVHENRGVLGAPIMSGLLVALFLSAWTTEVIGIHAIFGAFMFGAILPRSRSITTRVTERLEDVTVLFLLPVFFAVVGLSTQIGLVSGSEMWAVAGLIIAIAIVGKVGGSVVAGLAAGESLRSSTVIGVLMNARGITEIVILTIGRSLGVISPALFTIMVLMALVTTFMTTPLLQILYPRGLREGEMPGVAAPEPAAGRGRRVMVGVTDPVTARPLLQLVRGLRGPDGRKPEVSLASVVAPPGYEQVRANLSGLDDAAGAAAEGLEQVRGELAAAGVATEVVTVVGTDASEELWRLAVQRGTDLILIGSHQAYLGYRPLGGVAGDLLREAPCDVAVLVGMDAHREGANGPVGVWFRGEQPDLAALELAAAVARGRRAKLRVISPIEVELPARGVVIEPVVLTQPTVAYALAAVEGTSLMVVAPPGTLEGALPALREAVIERASVPVLVVRGAQTAAGTADLPDDTLAPGFPGESDP